MLSNREDRNFPSRSRPDVPSNKEDRNFLSLSHLNRTSNGTSFFPFHLQSNTKTLVEIKTKLISMFCTLNKAKIKPKNLPIWPFNHKTPNYNKETSFTSQEQKDNHPNLTWNQHLARKEKPWRNKYLFSESTSKLIKSITLKKMTSTQFNHKYIRDCTRRL